MPYSFIRDQHSIGNVRSHQITRRNALGLCLAASSVSGFASTRAQAAVPSVAGQALQPLGIGLEGWPYPGPVSFLPVVAEGHNLRMAYMDFAPSASPNGRCIFLLHGKNFDSSYWSYPVAWLRQAGFRVIVPDQIGFNKSSKPDISYSFEFLAKNTMALADALSLDKITILGHSTGGALAVRIASIYPSRIDMLVLEDPIGLVDYRLYIPPQETQTLVAAEYAYTIESYRAFIAHFFPLLPPASYECFVTWRMRTTLSPDFDSFARASALTYQMIYREPTQSFYAGLHMPVLLTAGTKDHSVPLMSYAPPSVKPMIPSLHTAAQHMMKNVRNGKFVSFSDVGHVPHLEVPENFKKEVLIFLNS